jgi:hypothetical protein
VLGYTKNPKSGFNLTTEYKNVKDSKIAMNYWQEKNQLP